MSNETKAALVDALDLLAALKLKIESLGKQLAQALAENEMLKAEPRPDENLEDVKMLVSEIRKSDVAAGKLLDAGEVKKKG